MTPSPKRVTNDLELVKPEGYLISQLKEQPRIKKSLDKLNWDQYFENRLRNVIEHLFEIK